MPKGRYAIMRRYMPLKGQLGLDMMQRTCTVQVNLDYSSEADMARKLRVSLALQPVATALFANSPFIEGKPSGYLSSRARVWTDTDPDRTGMPALMFEPGFGFERYVEWLLDVPMYFLLRDGGYQDVAGESFRDFMRTGRSSAARRARATLGDFADHMTTAFTDVRLKRFLEMRGSDAGRGDMMVAQSALWTGLLYDEAALAAADALVRRHPWQDYVALRAEVPRLALGGAWQGGTVRDLARDVLGHRPGWAAGARRARRVRPRRDRSILQPLDEIVAAGSTQAEHWLERYDGAWHGDVSQNLCKKARCSGHLVTYFREYALVVRTSAIDFSFLVTYSLRETVVFGVLSLVMMRTPLVIDNRMSASPHGNRRNSAAVDWPNGGLDGQRRKRAAAGSQDAGVARHRRPVVAAAGAARPSGRIAVEPASGGAGARLAAPGDPPPARSARPRGPGSS